MPPGKSHLKRWIRKFPEKCFVYDWSKKKKKKEEPLSGTEQTWFLKISVWVCIHERKEGGHFSEDSSLLLLSPFFKKTGLKISWARWNKPKSFQVWTGSTLKDDLQEQPSFHSDTSHFPHVSQEKGCFCLNVFFGFVFFMGGGCWNFR